MARYEVKVIEMTANDPEAMEAELETWVNQNYLVTTSWSKGNKVYIALQKSIIQ